MIYVIFFCTSLIGHPQMDACNPASSVTYPKLESCQADAAKMPIKADAPPHAAYVCLPRP